MLMNLYLMFDNILRAVKDKFEAKQPFHIQIDFDGKDLKSKIT